VLITVATLLGRNLRNADMVARYGGEEFALMLAEAGRDAAAMKIDQIRKTVRETQLDLPDRKEPSRLTFSAGIAVYPEDGDTLELLIATADQRLLSAKRQGRDRVIASPVTGEHKVIP
jgi:diguanylate cyclase (GGDEF)-like protein